MSTFNEVNSHIWQWKILLQSHSILHYS